MTSIKSGSIISGIILTTEDLDLNALTKVSFSVDVSASPDFGFTAIKTLPYCGGVAVSPP